MLTDSLVFSWINIGTSNPAYIPSPTDYFVIDFTPYQGPQSIGSVLFYDGSHFQADPNVTNLGTVVLVDGAIATVNFTTTVVAYLQPSLYEGSALVSALATTVVLTGDGNLVNSDGATDITVVTTYQSVPITAGTITFYDGATAVLTALSTRAIITDWFWAGEAMLSSLTIDPQFQFGAVFYDGATAVLATIAARQSLPSLIAYDGATFEPFLIGNLENYYFWEGSNVSSSLSTKVDLTADGKAINSEGDALSSNLTTASSQPLASSWPIYTGESFTSAMLIRPSASLTVDFALNIGLQLDFSTSTHYFDLAHQYAVSQPDDYYYWKNPLVHWFNLTNSGTQTQPGALSTGFNTYMNLTLAVHDTLQPQPMYQGESFGIYNFWPLLASTGSMGFGMAVLDLKFNLAIPLCIGNFIPDGAAVNAELSIIDNTSCSVDQAFDGSQMIVKLLESNIRESTVWYAGEDCYSTLTTEPGISVIFYDGSHLFVASNVELTLPMYQGEFLTVEFAPLTVVFYDGATMSAPSINTNYFVYFLETGCLDNEYTPTTIVNYNPFGPPPTANIELKPYYHQIQAECT